MLFYANAFNTWGDLRTAYSIIELSGGYKRLKGWNQHTYSAGTFPEKISNAVVFF